MNDVIARRLANLRKGKGLSQSELSEKIGISRQTISKWERGISLPGVDNLTILASFYELDADKIMSLEQDELTIKPETKSSKAKSQSSNAKKPDKIAASQSSKKEKKPAEIAGEAPEEAKTLKKEQEPVKDQAEDTLPETEVKQESPEPPKENPVQVHTDTTKSQDDKNDENKEEKVEVAAQAALKNKSRKKIPFSTLLFSLCIVIIYLALGLLKDLWHPAWLIFFLIPIYHSIIKRKNK